AFIISEEDVEPATDTSFFERIVRSIQFPPAFHKAGMQILGHFSSVIQQKYPDTNVKIAIEQQGMLVRMIIDTPDGMRDIIEETLNEYGQVMAGKMKPED